MSQLPSPRADRTRRRPRPGSRRRLSASAVGIAAVALTVVAGGLQGGPSSAAPDAKRTAGPTTPVPPTLLRAAPATAAASAPTPAPAVRGEHRLVTLDSGALPERSATGTQRLRLPVGTGEVVVDLATVDQSASSTTWQGGVEGEALGSFTLVESDGTLRGSLISPTGTYTLTPADPGRYWWTRVEAQVDGLSHGDGVVVGGPASATAPAERLASSRLSARKGKVKVGVMFGYTKGAKAELGGTANVKAAARLVIAQTNDAFANSGVKAKVKFRGLVKTKGRVTGDPVKNAFAVARPGDGSFDNLQRVRRRHGGDIVHLLSEGNINGSCGGGLIPYKPSTASSFAGASSTFVGCLPYLVATHEIGHNFGADHNDYPGVGHVSRTKGSYGFANPAGSYITVMSYYEPCSDVGNYTCVRLPVFSSPKNTYGGQPVGSGKSTNNSRVIKLFAPRVARYVR